MKINQFHLLETKNIYFKSLNVNEVMDIHSYASDEKVSCYIGWKLMNTLEETSEHIETMLKRESAGTHLYASIFLKTIQKIIGTAIIFNFDQEAKHAEIGYVLHKNYWGKGYGTEIVALMSDFAFNSLNLHKLNARVVDANIASIRVLENNGYEQEGRLRDNYFIAGRYYDALLYGKIQH
jgi:ribosomal-protein-alanine N-acetyltransferase